MEYMGHRVDSGYSLPPPPRSLLRSPATLQGSGTAMKLAAAGYLYGVGAARRAGESRACHICLPFPVFRPISSAFIACQIDRVDPSLGLEWRHPVYLCILPCLSPGLFSTLSCVHLVQHYTRTHHPRVLVTPTFDDADEDTTVDDVDYDMAGARNYDVLKLHDVT